MLSNAMDLKKREPSHFVTATLEQFTSFFKSYYIHQKTHSYLYIPKRYENIGMSSQNFFHNNQIYLYNG